MQVEDRQKLTELIENELLSIDKHIDELKQRCQPVSPDNAIGRISRMEAIGERGVHQTALAAAQQRKQALKTALHRIANDDDYGLCEACDQPVPLARLMLVPESRYCVSCLEKRNGS